jgi:hypothetical protein
MRQRRERGVSGGGGASHWPSAKPYSMGMLVGYEEHGEPRDSCPRPPPLFIALATGAHPPLRVGRPRSGRSQGV